VRSRVVVKLVVVLQVHDLYVGNEMKLIFFLANNYLAGKAFYLPVAY
jgi:hypothetical protein